MEEHTAACEGECIHPDLHPIPNWLLHVETGQIQTHVMDQWIDQLIYPI